MPGKYYSLVDLNVSLSSTILDGLKWKKYLHMTLFKAHFLGKLVEMDFIAASLVKEGEYPCIKFGYILPGRGYKGHEIELSCYADLANMYERHVMNKLVKI